jgi:subtilisin family serine protease
MGISASLRTFGLPGVVLALIAALLAAGTVEPASASAPQRGGPVVTWEPSAISVEVEPGGMTLVDLDLHLRESVDDARLEATPSLADMVTLPDVPPGRWDAGERPLTLAVGAPAAAEAGDRKGGTVHLRTGERTISRPLRIDVTVTEAEPGDTHERHLRPSPARFVETEVGAVLFDEVLVAPDPERGAPEVLIDATATRHDATVVGGLPELGLFQLRIPTASSLGDLHATWSAIEADDDVEYAGPYLLQSLASEHLPDDPEWDTWSEAGGNNWHLKAIDAPEAWRDETGSPDVRVAVIDVDFDPEHEDLDFRSIVGDRITGIGHGTHVAGTACATGDNGVGVTGVAWECDLLAYEIGAGGPAIDPVLAANSMVAAARSQADVVNMSFGVEACAALQDPQLRATVEANERLYRLGVSRAEVHHRPLWVASAGNRECDRDDLPPASLSAAFPRSFLSVAATDRDGDLSNFSNHGPNTTNVAAPGGRAPSWMFFGGQGIHSTLPSGCSFFRWLCGSRYGEMAGTSMAAPQVTGAAALMFSANSSLTAEQARQCMIASTSDGRTVAGHGFNEINVASAVACAQRTDGAPELDLPEEVDIVFSIDLTGSMGGVLTTVKNEIGDTLERLQELAPDTDFRFAVTTFEDYPGYYDSTSCGSGYAATYGSFTDEPFRIDQSLTGDVETIATTVNGLTLGNGADLPESYGRVLWELAQDDTGADLEYREEALTLVVMFGDDLPHDPDLHAAFPDGAAPAIPQDLGIDPGRSGTINCGGDDIRFHEDALGSLQQHDIRLLYVNNSRHDSYIEAWNYWSSLTGGASVRIDPGGTEDGGLTLVIANLIAAIESS